MRATGPTPIYPILFAVYFVLFLLSQNLDAVVVSDAVPVVAIALVGAAVATALGAHVLRDIRRGSVVAGAGAIAFFAYGHVATALGPYGVPGWVQQAGWVALLAGALVLALRGGERLLIAVTRGLNVVALLLVALTLATILPHELGRSATGATAVPVPVVTGQAASGPKRDIYYLIFDRYASRTELQKTYGIDDPLPDWLRKRGFYVAEDSHANYVNTQLSLATSLNMTYLDEVAARMGPDSDDYGPIFDMLHAHAVARFLKTQGYTYIQVGSRFQPTNVNPYADENPTPDSASDFLTAVIDISILPALSRRLGFTKSTPARERYYQTGLYQFRVLDSLVQRPGPKLVFVHILIPHPPYVFAADGSFVAEEDDPNELAKEYGGMVAYAGGRIEALVSSLLALPEDRRPIIVIQADEGPYPDRYGVATRTFDWAQATNDEVRLKYGILNAYYLPGLTGETGLYPSITPVNSFRLILARYFGADLPLLPDRIYTSGGKLRPYDLTDVTDRIGQP